MSAPVSRELAAAEEGAVERNAVATASRGGPVAGGESPSAIRNLPLWTRWKFGLIRTFLGAWVRTFSLKGLFAFGRFFGMLEYLINFKRRGRYRAALARIYPDGLSARRQQRIIRHYFQRTRCDKLLYLVFDHLPKDKILKRIRFHNRGILDDALRRGNGVYVLLSHNGSHHVAGLLMALLGYRCAGIRDRNEGASRQFIQECYAETFPEFRAIRVLYADSFPRDIFRCFQENRVVASALDVGRERGAGLKTCRVRMFGETRDFLTGTLQIALRCRATIVQAFVVSRPNYYFRLLVNDPPLYVPAADGPRDDGPELVADLLQKYADGIAQHVRKYPDHLSRI